MNIIRKIVVGIAGIVVVALALSLAAPKAVHAVTSLLVTVTNTPSVNVANTPTVNVGSLPAVQIGNNVNATVTNTSTNPVPTSNNDEANSFAANGNCSFSSNTCVMSLYGVPSNEVAVVESVSYSCNTPNSVSIFFSQLFYSAGAGSYSEFLPSPAAVPSGFGGQTTDVALNLKSHVPAGASLSLVIDAQAGIIGNQNGSGCVGGVTGYLLPKP